MKFLCITLVTIGFALVSVTCEAKGGHGHSSLGHASGGHFFPSHTHKP